MESPIARLLNWVDSEQTWPLKMGENVFDITMRESFWNYLDSLMWHGFDIDALLDFCGANLINEDPSDTLRQYLYLIGRHEYEEHGIELYHRAKS